MDDRSLIIRSATVPEVATVVEPLVWEYLARTAEHVEQVAGIRLSDEHLAQARADFHGNVSRLLGPRGRLLVAQLDGELVGVGALKPVDGATAEIKRMYVRPGARGLGIGRALFERLLAAARAEHYVTVRLETVRVLTAALAMYRAAGFREVSRFEGSEIAGTDLDPITVFMMCDLDADADADAAPRGRSGPPI